MTLVINLHLRGEVVRRTPVYLVPMGRDIRWLRQSCYSLFSAKDPEKFPALVSSTADARTL